MSGFNILDSVRIKDSDEVGFISCDIGDDLYAVNTGDDDNQPICRTSELELVT